MFSQSYSLINQKGDKTMMEDMLEAMEVTVNCIDDVGNGDVIKPKKRLLLLGIDNALIPSLKATIATDKKIGLPSVKSNPYTIEPDLLTINENSTVNDVFLKVFKNGVKV
jgi:hypothetical protein